MAWPGLDGLDWLDAQASALRVAVGTLMLLGAAVLDIRSRRVPNRYWYPFVAATALLDAYSFWRMGWEAALLPLTLAAALSGLFYLLWRLGLYGGADAKGLMVLALLAPFPFHPWLGDPLPVGLPPALDAITNGTFAVLAFPILTALLNLLRGNLAFPALLLGVPMALEEAEARHVWPMQAPQPDGTLRWVYWQRAAASRPEAYAALRAAGVARVWATPKVPLMAFIALGWAVAAAWGNVALRLVLAL